MEFASKSKRTPEEQEALLARVREHMKKANALWIRESEECPDCGGHVNEMKQIGRCVYAFPCGCRQGQGTLHKAWRK